MICDRENCENNKDLVREVSSEFSDESSIRKIDLVEEMQRKGGENKVLRIDDGASESFVYVYRSFHRIATKFTPGSCH